TAHGPLLPNIRSRRICDLASRPPSVGIFGRFRIVSQLDAERLDRLSAQITVAARALSPIVDDVGAGAAIAGIVIPVHGYTQNLGAKSAGDEMPIGFVACHVRTSQQVRHADSDRQSLARVEQSKIIAFGRSPVVDCTEFDEASVCAGFAAWPVVTDRKRCDATGTVNQTTSPRPWACVAAISPDRSRPG